MTHDSHFSQGTSNPIKIIANIFISFIGSGILGLPYAFKESGIFEGVVILLLVSVLSVKAMKLLVDCKYKVLSSSYDYEKSTEILLESVYSSEETDEDTLYSQVKQIRKNSYSKLKNFNYGTLGFNAMGNTGKWLVNCCLLISQLGFCCAYLIFIIENLSNFFPLFQKSYFWLMFLLPGLFALSLLKHLDRLAVFSFFAQISTIFALAIVFWFDFDHIQSVGQRLHPKQYSLKGFPLFFAIAIYSYEGAGMILALEESLKVDIRPKFFKYLASSLSAVTILYGAFGIAGYMSFGDQTNPIITLNLPKGNGVDFAMLVKLCLCISLYFTYPVMMFPVTTLIETSCITPSTIKEVILRVILVIITGLIILVVPNFTVLLALIGASCCSLLAFILPGLFHIQLFRPTLTGRQWFLNIILILFGVVGTIFGLVDAIQRMIILYTQNSTILPSESLAALNNTTIQQ